MIHIDRDRPTDGKCRHHCSPSCHPAQTGPDWKYGCLHKAWPQNRYGDFCPIVDCMANPAFCEIPRIRLSYFMRGRRTRIKNAKAKLEAFEYIRAEKKDIIPFVKDKDARRKGFYMIRGLSHRINTVTRKIDKWSDELAECHLFVHEKTIIKEIS